MEIPNHRAGATARSGATHVIDPTQENAVAVNVEQLDRAGLAQPVAAPRRAKRTPADGSLTSLSGDGSGVAADPITPEAE